MRKISALSMNTGQVEGLPKNPRFIKDKKYESLVKSIKEYPEMLGLREVIAYDTGKELVVIAGNMWLKACKEAGIKDVPVKILPQNTPIDKLKAYTIKDNLPYGEWDIDLLANEWDIPELEELGFDLAELGLFDGEGSAQDGIDDTYTRKIVAPVYEPKGEKPPIKELIDREKTVNLIAEIEQAELPEDIEYFLKMAAERHSVFHFRKIAEFYCHADEQVQDLMEKSGLVIIDFKKAIEYGFVHMTERLGELAYLEESENDEG